MPVLTVISGPTRGKTFDLEPRSKFSIGRDPLGSLYLVDTEVSRHHAEIFEQNGVFHIKDLKSTNRTFVNGVQITQQTLNDKDHIKIGDNLMVFVLEETIVSNEAQTDKAKVRPEPEKKFGASTVEIRLDPARERAEKLRPERADKEVDVQNLSTFYQISQLITSEKNPAVLLDKILKLIVEATKADQGYILVWEKSTDKITGQVMYPQQKEGLEISRTIVKRVARYARSILTSDALVDPALKESESVVRYNIKSVICVPCLPATLTQQRQVVIYLESDKLNWSFTQPDLELATTMALQVGTALVT